MHPDTPEVKSAVVAPLTAPVTLRLATPLALRQGLALAGFAWTLNDEAPEHAAGLYTWVVPLDGHALDVCPILYIGIGSDWVTRVAQEERWATAEYIHGHGMAVHRTQATVIGGAVTATPTGPDREALLADLGVAGVNGVKAYFADGVPTPYENAAEHLAVRMAMHLGDVGAPVNSQFAGAWSIPPKNTKAANTDWVAFASSEVLRRRQMTVKARNRR